MLQNIMAICALIPMVGCATKSITFKSDGKARVGLVSLDNLATETKVLGDTPLTVPLDDLSGKVVRIDQPGKIPAYWVFAETAGVTNEAFIKLQADASATTPEKPGANAPLVDTKSTTNRVFRLIMRAYKELTGKRFRTAAELADQASAIDPELAAPFVIKGMALLQQGDNTSARAALMKARSLDPGDNDIDKLMTSMGLSGS